MKICFCISGQLRGSLNCLDSLRNIISVLEVKHQVKVVFSLWSNIGNKVDGAIALGQMKRIFSDEAINIFPPYFYSSTFWDHLPHVLESIKPKEDKFIKESLNTWFPNSIIDIESSSMLLEFPYERGDKNSIKMLYKRWRCNELLKKYCMDSSEEFDLVIVTRPDAQFTLLNDEIDLTEEATVYVPHPDAEKKFTNDIIAYGDQDVMDTYCSLFSKSISKELWRGIHLELNEFLKSQGIVERPLKFIKFDFLYRENPIGLDAISGRNKMLDSALKLASEGIKKKTTKLSCDDQALQNIVMMRMADLYEQMGEVERAFNCFLGSYLSTIRFDSFERGNRGFNVHIRERFCNYLISLELYSFSEIRDQISSKFNNICKDNTEMLLQSLKVKQTIYSSIIIRIIENGDFDRLLELDENCVVKHHVGKRLYNKGLSIASRDENLSLTIISVAHRICPSLKTA